MKALVFAAVLVLAMSGASWAQDQRALFNAAKQMETSSPTKAFEAMSEMAGDGYIPAKDRIGYYYRKGIGTEPDLEAARRWYREAVAGGHIWSFASLARVEIELGNGDAARALLEQAAAEKRPGTQRLLGTSHIDGKLGEGSDPQLGRQILIDLAADGDEKAARDLVLRYNWNRLGGTAPEDVVAQVERAGLAGDPKYAEAALVYLTSLGDKSPAISQRRSALIAVPGIRARVLSPERVRLAADTRPGKFWRAVEEILEETDADAYSKTVSTAFWINKNSWIRVMQKELRELGYYNGRANARVTKRTIRAQNRFCRDEGIWAICADGPLRGATVRAVAEAIAKRKNDG